MRTRRMLTGSLSCETIKWQKRCYAAAIVVINPSEQYQHEAIVTIELKNIPMVASY
ncbi:MAG: hypothetical protein QXL52_00995 [Nitrososphaerales archaeon]